MSGGGELAALAEQVNNTRARNNSKDLAMARIGLVGIKEKGEEHRWDISEIGGLVPDVRQEAEVLYRPRRKRPVLGAW